jgi:hemin uptake protein HemP
MTALKALSRTAEIEVAPLPAYGARDLTEGGDLARIVLDGQVYTLRITRAGKLILTK